MNKYYRYILVVISCMMVSCVLTSAIFLIFFEDDGDIPYTKGIDATVSIEVFDGSQKIGAGTGFSIWNDSIVILTNAHVILTSSLGDTQIILKDANENKCAVIVSYIDIDRDVAILTPTSSNLSLIPLDLNISDLKYGQVVYVCSNARNYGISVQNGIISIPNLHIYSGDIDRLSIQTTIPLNKGSSGAPLINESGEVVGMMSFRMKDESGNLVQGLSYAIPSSTLIDVLSEYN